MSGKPPDPIDEAVEMTVLIAMPTPHPHFPSTSSPSSSSSTLHISHTDFPTLYQPDPVLDDIPPVEIATTEVPITCTTDSDRWSLDKLRTEAIGRNGVDVPLVQGRGVRIERTDGFRGTS